MRCSRISASMRHGSRQKELAVTDLLIASQSSRTACSPRSQCYCFSCLVATHLGSARGLRWPRNSTSTAPRAMSSSWAAGAEDSRGNSSTSQRFPTAKRILDVGCGTGSMTFALAEAADLAEIAASTGGPRSSCRYQSEKQGRADTFSCSRTNLSSRIHRIHSLWDGMITRQRPLRHLFCLGRKRRSDSK